EKEPERRACLGVTGGSYPPAASRLPLHLSPPFMGSETRLNIENESSPRRDTSTRAQREVGKPESATVDDLPAGDVQSVTEGGRCPTERVELAAFANGIDSVRQPAWIPALTDECRVQLGGVDAGDRGAHTGCEHPLRQLGRVTVSEPDRKQRLDPRGPKHFLPVGADVFQVDV